MKVTGGKNKGRKIKGKGLGTCSAFGSLRPTASMVREAVFNIIGPAIEEAVVADLYSGTGTMGMEAMSRGASRVYYIEADRERASNIEDTIDGCGCCAKATILNMKAEDFVSTHAKAGRRVDVIYLDPPYASDELLRILPLIAQSGILADGAIVLAEHSRKLELPEAFGSLLRAKLYRYGDTALTLYRVGE